MSLKRAFHSAAKEDHLREWIQGADIGSFASLIRHCGVAKAYTEGKRVHSRLIQAGYEGNVFLGNLLVQMYGKCGRLDEAEAAFERICGRNLVSWNIMLAAFAQKGHLREAKDAFEKMPCRDSISWNTIIAAYGQHGNLKEAKHIFDEIPDRNTVSWNSISTAYAQNGHCSQALVCFRKMDLEGLQADAASVVIVLDACATLEAVAEGRILHYAVLEAGLLEINVKVGNSLIWMYSKCGASEEAKTVFESMLVRDVMSWTALATAYSRSDRLEDAKLTLERMPLLNVVSSNVMIAGYNQAGNVEAAKRVFDSMPEQTVVSRNSMLAAYTQNGHMREALDLFENMQEKDVVSWTTLMAGCNQNGQASSALGLLRRMLHEGARPNRITFVCALDACSSLGAVYEGQKLHAEILECGLNSDANLANSLVNMYGKCGCAGQARLVFDAMSFKSVVSWNSLVTAYGHGGDDTQALVLLQTMQIEGVLPNEVTFISPLDKSKSLEEGKVLHQLAADSGYDTQSILGCVIINFYGRFARLKEAKLAFDKVVEKTLVLHTSLISAYAQNGYGHEAIRAFMEMDLQGVPPNKVTFISIFDACSSSASTTIRRLLHAELIHTISDYSSDTPLCNSLLNMYSKGGNLGAARSIFDGIVTPDVITWNGMLLGYAQSGCVEQVLGLQAQMVLEGFMPNELTFTSIFSACSHGGLVFDSLRWFASICGDYNLQPTVDHFLCMIGILGRAGKIEEAEELIRVMPYEPDFVAWSSLLGACRLAGDVSRGAYAAECGHRLEPDRNAPYLLLSSTYLP